LKTKLKIKKLFLQTIRADIAEQFHPEKTMNIALLMPYLVIDLSYFVYHQINKNRFGDPKSIEKEP